jgi:hypothetical protein
MNDGGHRNGRHEKRGGCGAESGETREARRHLSTTSRRRRQALRAGSIRDRKRGERFRMAAAFAGEGGGDQRSRLEQEHRAHVYTSGSLARRAVGQKRHVDWRR